MKKSTKSIFQRHDGIFDYGPKQIPFHFWSHTDGRGALIDTVIFLGTSQTGRVARWVAGNAPTGTVVVEGLPHKEADRSARDIREFAHAYTNAAFLTVLKECKISSAHMVAESQAAPGVIWSALDHVNRVQNIALIAPLGFTHHILGNTPQERLRELKKRAFLSARQIAQTPLHDRRNFYLNLLMLHAVLFDARWEVSGQKYAVGASHDLREDCRKLSDRLHRKGNGLTLVLGEQDRLFPPKEIMISLAEVGATHIANIILKTSHVSLAIRDGRHVLSRAVEAVRQQG